MKQCPACGANNSSDQPSCSICGASLSQVADSGAARTLFGMPALKFGEGEGESQAGSQADASPEPSTRPAATPGPGTRPGFRALDAVELDGSVGSLDVRTLDPSEPPAAGGSSSDAMRSTQFGAPSPFKAGQLPPIGTGDADFESVAEPSDPPAAEAPDPIRSTQFGAPSPFGKPAQPAPEPVAIASTRMGMPVFNVDGEAAEEQPSPAPAGEAEKQENYRTLVGPPLPLAEAARQRDAAKSRQADAGQAQAQENYRTLVGPPVPIAEAARARDAAKARRAAEQSAAGEARGPSIIVDDDLDESQGAGPSVIVDEPVTPRGSSEATARTAKPLGAAEVSRTDQDDERAAASRFAAAMDTDERTAMVITVQERGYGWLIFLVLIVAGIALALWLTRDAQAFQPRVDAVEVIPGEDGLTLSATVLADRPAAVTLDGQDAPSIPVEQQGEVRFDLPADGLTPGETTLALQVAAGDAQARLPVELVVWLVARIGEVDAVGAPVPVALDVRPGWSPAEGFEPVGASRSRFATTVDPAPALAQVDGPGGLTGAVSRAVRLTADGEDARTVELSVEVPLPRTPLVLTAPARAWRRAAESVVIAGRTAPGALVKVGGHNALADDAGRFRLTVPLGGGREQTLEVVADGPGARPTVEMITVQRLSPAAGVAQAAALRAQQDERLGTVGRTPRYDRWRSDAEALRGRAVAFEGRLVAVERGVQRTDDRDALADRAVVATCDRGDHCPVWITTHSPILVDAGQRVAVSGTLAGTETWRASDRFVTAPRVEGALLAP